MRNYCRYILLSVLLAGSIPRLWARDIGASWVRVSDGSLTVYTQGSTAEATVLIHSLAQLRSALGQASPFHASDDAKLRIIAFHSEADFNQYRLNAGSCAFYQQTRHGEYVVLQDMEHQHHDVSMHEFTHFVLAHSGVTLPLWLNEGLADFYSTYQIAGDHVVFGRSVTGRLGILRHDSWLPLRELFDVSTSSSYYSDPGRMALFYSESWALTHMLVASPAYAARFPQLLHALGEGRTAVESVEAVYNKTLPQIQDDLHEYVDRQHLPLVEAPLAFVYNGAPPISVAAISTAEMDVTLADLAVTNPDVRASLETRLASAANQLSGNPEAEEALGYLALRQGRPVEATTHFQLAVDRHSSDPSVLFYLAHLKHAAGAPSNQVVPLLQQSLALNPDLSDARLELAFVDTADGNFQEALAALQKLTQPRPENAYAATYTEAYCYAHLEKFPEALSAAGRAQKLAANDRDRAEVSELMDFIKQEADEQAGGSPKPQ